MNEVSILFFNKFISQIKSTNGLLKNFFTQFIILGLFYGFISSYPAMNNDNLIIKELFGFLGVMLTFFILPRIIFSLNKESHFYKSYLLTTFFSLRFFVILFYLMITTILLITIDISVINSIFKLTPEQVSLLPELSVHLNNETTIPEDPKLSELLGEISKTIQSLGQSGLMMAIIGILLPLFILYLHTFFMILFYFNYPECGFFKSWRLGFKIQIVKWKELTFIGIIFAIGSYASAELFGLFSEQTISIFGASLVSFVLLLYMLNMFYFLYEDFRK